MTTSDMLNKEIEDFNKNFVSNKFDVKTLEKRIEVAVDCAYRTAQRTFKGIKNYHEPKNGAFSNLAINIKRYFDNEGNDEQYDVLHKKWCEELKNMFGEYKITYGQAQKIINMTMKYLYCVLEKKSTLFQKCHMTLDKYTLQWFCAQKNDISDELKKYLRGIKYEWSKIDDSAKYQAIQEKIREILAKSKAYAICCGNNPPEIDLPQNSIEAEFIIWHQEQINELRKLIDKNRQDFDRLGIQYI